MKLKVYEETTTRRKAIQKDLEGIEKLLGAADPYSNQPRTNNLRYAGFSEAAYTEAVDQYIEGFGKR